MGIPDSEMSHNQCFKVNVLKHWNQLIKYASSYLTY